MFANRIGHRLAPAVTQALRHLRLKSPLNQHLRGLLEQANVANQSFRLLVVRQQAVRLLRFATVIVASWMQAVPCQMTVLHKTNTLTPAASSALLQLQTMTPGIGKT